ncbi:hydrolase [Kitasatospora cathayae]|uniref:Hydrolase n=1 Tax=Kitasatospora cathayae TaxID=3004092 RepID=A0ABY7QGI2_9ACTN|nr:hydrolase [Kitasatospora sp. HUAS 3-15]WBP91876.1 hydrolase [Kitasatospora sp. HUAS 3-15]
MLTPANAALALIDYQPQPVFHIQSMDRQLLVGNVVALARTARLFRLPTVLTTVVARDFAGPLLPQLAEVFPEQEPIDRTNLNAWQVDAFRSAVEATGRSKLLMAGIWTEVCLMTPALSALEAGYEVYFVVDAVGGVSAEAHTAAVHRLVRAGAVPVTWIAVLQELQRDWSRTDTVDGAYEIARAYGGSWGQGIVYRQDPSLT